MTGPDAPVAPPLGRWQRALVTGVGVVLVAHTVLLALWLAPSSPVRDAVGGARLTTYVDPYFRQGDETVGIGSNRVDETLSLRALVRPEGGGEVSTTAWNDVTAAETRATRGEVSAARAYQTSRRLAANLNFALLALTPEQRGILADTSGDVSPAALERQLGAADPGNGRAVENFMAQDQMATQFASLWLGARYADREVVRVQYRVGRRVVPEGERRAAALSGVDYSWLAVGTRAVFRGEPEARLAFDDFVAGVSRG